MSGTRSKAAGALIAFLAVASCDAGDTTAPQSIDVVVASAQLTVMCGTSGTMTASVSRGGGYDGTVVMTVTGLPSGALAALTTSELTGDVTSTTIVITVGEAVEPGTYTVLVNASSSIGSRTATFQLVVLDTPHFHMTVEPSMLTVAPGASGWATVNIQRRGAFTGAVVLSVAEARPGLSVSFDPSSIEGTRGIVSVRVDAGVPDGNNTFTIVGSGTDVPPATAGLSVGVRTVGNEWYTVAEPPELTVARGSSGAVLVHVVTDAELPGWANYSLVNPPSGINASFDYHYDWGYPATMALSVASTVTAGAYTLVLATTFPGVPTKTIAIGLTVTEP